MPISAIAGLAGSGIDAWVSTANARRNVKSQKQFAKQGIQWKVEDARKAGVHPLAALGAQTHSFSPVAVGSDFGTSLANAGQDISRAMNATRTTDQRTQAYQKTVQDLTLDRMRTENEILKMNLASSVNRAIQGSGPPMPSAQTGKKLGVPTSDAIKAEQLKWFGGIIPTQPHLFTDAEDAEKHYGDFGGAMFGVPHLMTSIFKGSHSAWKRHAAGKRAAARRHRITVGGRAY